MQVGCSAIIDDKALLPPATGESGEIVLVMDSAKWMGPLGDEIRNTFRAPFPGLIQDEPVFNLVYVDPDKLNSVLRNSKNMVFVNTLEGNSKSDIILRNYFTKESIETIKSDSSIFMSKQTDLFAKGQSVMHLFQQNNDLLINHIINNRVNIQHHFEEIEKNRYYQAIYKAPREKGIENHLLEKHQFFIKVPYGYEIALETGNSSWIRLMDNKVDKNLFITYRDYTEEKAFNKENIVALRDNAWRKFLLGDDSLSYMVTEPLVPVDSVSLNWRNKFTVEVRGVWKLNNNSMGGPFLGYLFVDEAMGRLYYIEGFVFAPGKKKRNILRELETILWTFETQSEYSS
ncbi:MAG: DUF4837 domain-containing protein [Cyclobacteriaceae bacterium]|nr:MAG: DUF4837 domain-containing protein [Cyclobacteriaceae bacterium]